MIFKFNNILGEFFFNEHLKLTNKTSDNPPNEKLLEKILEYFADNQFNDDFHKKNMELTKKQIKESTSNDIHINQAISSIEEITRIVNMLTKRVREWYSYFSPEVEKRLANNEAFINVILKGDIKNIQSKEGIKHSMGGSISPVDFKLIISLATQVKTLIEERKHLESYLDEILEKEAPNMKAIIGSQITAKLISHAGSLKSLSKMPASTIQLLGAEKALFRHLKNKKAKCPKFGVIFENELVSGQKRKNQGRAARLIASKLNIAAKVDYFKGKRIGEKYRKDIEIKLKCMR